MASRQNHSALHGCVDWSPDATRSTISFAGLPTPESGSSDHGFQRERAAVRSGFTDDNMSPPSPLYCFSHGTMTNTPLGNIPNELDLSSVNSSQRSARGTYDALSTTLQEDVVICDEKKVTNSRNHAVSAPAREAPASPRIKQEPNARATRQQTLRLRRQQQAIEQSRAEDSSVTSVDAVRIGRWIPQYVSPPPSSREPRKRSARLATKRKKSAPACVNLLDISSDDGSGESSQPLIKRFRETQATECNANQSIPVRHQRKASAQQKPSRQSSTTKKLPLSSDESKRSADTEHLVTFFFFAGDQGFGAVPASLKQCKAAKSFFDKAALALSLSSGRINENNVRAVTVAIDGFDWPLVIPWRDADGFRIMMQKVGDHVSQELKALNIKVTCIAKE